MVTILAFLLALLAIVLVHELGHLLAALYCKVPVRYFSIGLGPRLLSFNYLGVCWQLRILPVGGYVRFYEADEVDGSIQNKVYENQSAWCKSLILLAGPFFNIMLAYLIFVALHIAGGPPSQRAVIAFVEQTPNFVFENIQSGDEILAVDGQEIETVNQFKQLFLEAVLSGKQGIDILLLRQNKQVKAYVHKTMKGQLLRKDVSQILSAIVWQVFDKKLLVEAVEPGSSASIAGLQKGDVLLRIEGMKLHGWGMFKWYIEKHPKHLLRLEVMRLEKPMVFDLLPFSNAQGQGYVGLSIRMEHAPERGPKRHDSLLTSLWKAGLQVSALVRMTFSSIWGLFTGVLSFDNVSGPVSIAGHAGEAMRFGVWEFLNFVALLSVGVGMINLLPVPVLDGGQFVYVWLSQVFGFLRRTDVRGVFHLLSAILLCALFLAAFYNDLILFFG